MKLINLKLFRKERGLTQRQLGDVLHLPQSTVSYLENGLQEATDYLLSAIKDVFKLDNLDDYVYERKTYHNPDVAYLTKEERMNVFFEGDWNDVPPIDVIDGFQIICKTGNFSIAKDGTLFIDCNNGIGYRLSHYIICPDKFEEPNLLLSMTEKAWFDDEMYENFKRAYFIGCRIASIQPVRQLKKVAPS